MKKTSIFLFLSVILTILGCDNDAYQDKNVSKKLIKQAVFLNELESENSLNIKPHVESEHNGI